MRPADVKQQLHMVVVQRIEYGFAQATGLDQVDLTQMLQMVRDGGLRHVHEPGEVADTQVGQQ